MESGRICEINTSPSKYDNKLETEWMSVCGNIIFKIKISDTEVGMTEVELERTWKELDDLYYSTLARVHEIEKERDAVAYKIFSLRCNFGEGDTIINKEGIKALVIGVIFIRDGSYMLRLRKFRKNGKLYKKANYGYSDEEWRKV